MLKKYVVQRFFSVFFCFSVIICQVSTPNQKHLLNYERYKTFNIVSCTCNLGNESLFLKER